MFVIIICLRHIVVCTRVSYLIQMLLFYLPRQQCLCIHHQLFVASRGHFGVLCLSENVTRCIDPYTECHEGVCVCTDDAFEKNGACCTSVGQKHVIYTENHELLRVVEVGSAQYCMQNNKEYESAYLQHPIWKKYNHRHTANCFHQ